MPFPIQPADRTDLERKIDRIWHGIVDYPDADDWPATYRCPECGQPITVGTDGTERGHRRGTTYGRSRCSRRPGEVDPAALR